MAFNPVMDHPVHDALRRLIALQSNVILSDTSSDIDAQRRWYLERIFYLAHRAVKKIKKRLSLSISLNALGNLNASADAITQELNQYISNRNIGHIDNAFNQAEQGFQIYLFQAFPTDASDGGAEGEAIIESLKAASESVLKQLKSERDTISSDVSKLSASVSANNESVSALEAAISVHQEQSQSQVGEINEAYELLAQKFAQDFDDKAKEWGEARENEISNIKTMTDDLVQKISIKEDEARRTVQSVGDILTTGTYQKTANEESSLANIFRWITITLFGVGIAIVLINFGTHLYRDYYNSLLSP